MPHPWRFQTPQGWGLPTAMGSRASGSWSKSQIPPTTGAGTSQSKRGLRGSQGCRWRTPITEGPLCYPGPPISWGHTTGCVTPLAPVPMPCAHPRAPAWAGTPPWPHSWEQEEQEERVLTGLRRCGQREGREETPGQRATGQHPRVPSSHHTSRGAPSPHLVVTLGEPPRATLILGNRGDLFPHLLEKPRQHHGWDSCLLLPLDAPWSR